MSLVHARHIGRYRRLLLLPKLDGDDRDRASSVVIGEMVFRIRLEESCFSSRECSLAAFDIFIDFVEMDPKEEIKRTTEPTRNKYKGI